MGIPSGYQLTISMNNYLLKFFVYLIDRKYLLQVSLEWQFIIIRYLKIVWAEHGILYWWRLTDASLEFSQQVGGKFHVNLQEKFCILWMDFNVLVPNSGLKTNTLISDCLLEFRPNFDLFFHWNSGPIFFLLLLKHQ